MSLYAELSKKLGEGDLDGANKAAGNGILVNRIVAGIFLIFGLFFVPRNARRTIAVRRKQRTGN